MPEPAAPGAQRRVSQTMAAVLSGIHSSGSQPAMATRLLNSCSARSDIQVKTTTVRPAAAAKASTSARVTQRRQSENSWRMARRTSDGGFMGDWERGAGLQYGSRRMRRPAPAGAGRRVRPSAAPGPQRRRRGAPAAAAACGLISSRP